MCSCSGSCNCNSTTIPRGPQGVPGPSGNAATIAVGSVTALPAGNNPTISNGGSSSAAVFNFGIPAGEPGNNGDNGLNAFTTLTGLFIQPAVNSTVTIAVVNSSWAAVSQIIYIGNSLSFTDPGGFYKVVSTPTPTSILIMRIDWTIPGVTFRSTGTAVGAAGTLVTPSGTIGPVGETGPAGVAIIDAQWGIFGGGGGTNDKKISIEVPELSLVENGDSLECHTILKVNVGFITTGTYSVFIRIGATNIATNVSAIQFDIPFTNAGSSPLSSIVNMNYKIQKTGSNIFRAKGECFVSGNVSTSTLTIFKSSIVSSFISDVATNQTLTGGTWEDIQYVAVVANDEVSPKIAVIHHEVKVVKKSV